MKLHHAAASPFVRKVMIVLHETGQTGAVDVRTVGNTPMAPDVETAAANPLSKIPCLERDDGPALYDSRVICRYLDSLHSGRRLYPAGVGQWAALTLEALGDGICEAGLACVYEARFREEAMRSSEWIQAQKRKIARALDALDAQWLAHLAGPLDIGAISVAAALGYLDFRLGDMGWREGRPGLTSWHESFARRESYAATAPVG
jgi:glutathione S-transferase